MAPKTVLVTGANGYVGNGVARAFVRAGWVTYGLVRSESSATALAAEEIVPILGSIDDISSHQVIQSKLPTTLTAIASTTEDLVDYVSHYKNIVRLLRTLSTTSAANGVKPVVIFSSGCKDYGIGPHYHGDAGLAPHTEQSPINPHALLENRALSALEFLQDSSVFFPVVVRPTNVHGRSASYSRGFYEVAEACAKAGQPLPIPVPPTSITHTLHIDDCGNAYVAIAAHQNVEEIAGEVFNISAHRYETVDEIAKALVEEYGITAGISYIDRKELSPRDNPWPPALIDFPQWVGSEKLRKLTGWRDVRPLLTEALHVYRVAYEAASASGHEGIKKIQARVKMVMAERESNRW